MAGWHHIRGALDELRPATVDEVRALRDELHALGRRRRSQRPSP